MPADDLSNEPRRKRAKIVSACTECRRKKTKCNGEQPCRSCQKPGVPCIYPSSHQDERRNAHSRAALEAIEDRLKAIEDMLKAILRSQMMPADLDPAAVNSFLYREASPSPTVSSASPQSTPQPSHDFRLPPIHSLSAAQGEHLPPPLGYPQHPFHGRPEDIGATGRSDAERPV